MAFGGYWLRILSETSSRKILLLGMEQNWILPDIPTNAVMEKTMMGILL